MNKHKKRNLLLLLLVGRLGFIFFDAVTNKENDAEKIVYFKNIGVDYKPEHSAAPEKKQETKDDFLQNIETKAKILQDLKTLKNIYQQEKSPEILLEITKKQAQNYNFNEAWKNIQILEKEGKNVDINLFLYVYLNSNNINITQKDGIKKFPELLDIIVQKNLIGNQDYLFYGGLVEIRNKNYEKALELRNNVKLPQYQATISSFKKAIRSYDSSKAIPIYYQDGLVALTALKNGYFNIAKKIAVETTLKDEKYILPYQILAYSNFLTNNRDSAIEYFLKLTKIDKNNTEKYQFLIGVSYYQKQEYTSSVLYLSQNQDSKTQTENLRYMIMNYIKIQENKKLITSRQRLLGQEDTKKSDFFLYFYNIFYKGYFSQNKDLFNENPQLAQLFIEKCESKFGIDEDICIYGRIGKDIINNNLSQKNKIELISLSESYNQSYLYHILGDMSIKVGINDDGKKRYAKAISTSQDSKEINFIQKKLSSINSNF